MIKNLTKWRIFAVLYVQLRRPNRFYKLFLHSITVVLTRKERNRTALTCMMMMMSEFV